MLRLENLAKLSIEGADLRECESDGRDLGAEHFSALKDLKLQKCVMDAQSIESILGAPISLGRFEYSVLEQPSSGESPSNLGELRLMKIVLASLSKFQAQLQSLQLNLHFGELLQSPDFKDEFDFSQIIGLKELVLTTATMPETFPSFRCRTWCPINAFDKLPVYLCRIVLEHISNGLDVRRLVEALLRPEQILPLGLELVCRVTDGHERPLSKDDQAWEMGRLSAFHKSMTSLPLSRLLYVQRWLLDRDSFYKMVIWERTVEARREDCVSGVERSGAESGPYRLSTVDKVVTEWVPN